MSDKFSRSIFPKTSYLFLESLSVNYSFLSRPELSKFKCTRSIFKLNILENESLFLLDCSTWLRKFEDKFQEEKKKEETLIRTATLYFLAGGDTWESNAENSSPRVEIDQSRRDLSTRRGGQRFGV